MGCTGVVTASPKRADDTELDGTGLPIDWSYGAGTEYYVKVTDFPGQPFNKNVTPKLPGPFGICATVSGVLGCLFGQVVD